MQKVCVKSYFTPERFYEKMGYKRIDEGRILREKIEFLFVNMEKCL